MFSPTIINIPSCGIFDCIIPRLSVMFKQYIVAESAVRDKFHAVNKMLRHRIRGKSSVFTGKAVEKESAENFREKTSTFFEKGVDKRFLMWYNNNVLERTGQNKQISGLQISENAGVAQWQSS